MTDNSLDLIPTSSSDLADFSPYERKTLETLIRNSVPHNTMEAYRKDIRYLKAWCLAATNQELSFPSSPDLVVRFIIHHLYDAEEKRRDPNHGMPPEVEKALIEAKFKAKPGPHAPKTVRRRIATWATFHRVRGLASPTDAPDVKTILHRCMGAIDHQASHKSPKPVMLDELERLMATCATGSLYDLRDLALLQFIFASGGRRRSEPGKIRLEALDERPPQPIDPEDPDSETVPAMQVTLRRTKTTKGYKPVKVWLLGPPVTALKDWLSAAGISTPSAFVFPALRSFKRRIDGELQDCIQVLDRGLSGDSVREMLGRRCVQAGLDETLFTPHGMRAGYLTESHNKGVPIQQAMCQSLHKSLVAASVYYQDAEGGRSAAARLLVKPKKRPPVA